MQEREVSGKKCLHPGPLLQIFSTCDSRSYGLRGHSNKTCQHGQACSFSRWLKFFKIVFEIADAKLWDSASETSLDSCTGLNIFWGGTFRIISQVFCTTFRFGITKPFGAVSFCRCATLKSCLRLHAKPLLTIPTHATVTHASQRIVDAQFLLGLEKPMNKKTHVETTLSWDCPGSHNCPGTFLAISGSLFVHVFSFFFPKKMATDKQF